MHNKIQPFLMSALLLLTSHAYAASPWAKPEPIPAEPEVAAEDTATVPVEETAAPAAEATAEPAMEPLAAEPVAQPVEPAQPAEPMATTAEPAAPVEETLVAPTPIASQVIPEPMSVITLDFPRRGMNEEKVQGELGRPLEVIPAVGKPPITRWVYNDRIVYFEYSTVIHVVSR